MPDNSKVGTVGTEFVILFLPNHDAHSSIPYVIVTTPSYDPVTVDVIVDFINFHQTFTVTRFSDHKVQLPVSVYLIQGAEDKTVIIRSSSGVSVHLLSYRSTTTDAFLVMPTKGLGTKYIIASYYPYSSSYPSQLAISSLESETNIQITTIQGQSYQINLAPYHSYFFQGNGADDLTGSSVLADQPVAVFSGTECSKVPNHVMACDHLTAQMHSLENLGRNYQLVPFPSRRSAGFVYRVIAVYQDRPTHILITGGLEIDLEVGEFFEGNGYGNSITTIVADNPVIAVQYMPGYNAGDSTGDPSMILIPPTDLFTNSVTFPVFGYQQGDYYHASVTIPCEDASGLFLDDTTSIDNWYRLSSDDGTFCALQGTVTPYDVHTIGHTNPDAKYYVFVTSTGRFVSYTYSAGFNLRTGISFISCHLYYFVTPRHTV